MEILKIERMPRNPQGVTIEFKPPTAQSKVIRLLQDHKLKLIRSVSIRTFNGQVTGIISAVLKHADRVDLLMHQQYMDLVNKEATGRSDSESSDSYKYFAEEEEQYDRAQNNDEQAAQNIETKEDEILTRYEDHELSQELDDHMGKSNKYHLCIMIKNEEQTEAKEYFKQFGYIKAFETKFIVDKWLEQGMDMNMIFITYENRDNALEAWAKCPNNYMARWIAKE